MPDVLLKDLIEYSRDGEWGPAGPADDHVAVRIIRGTDFDAVRTGNLSELPVRYIPTRKAAQKALHAGDVLVETAGGTATRPTGRSLLIRSSHIAGSDLPLCCASFARFVRVRSDLADPAYFQLWFENSWKRRELLAFHTQHTGVARFQWTTCAETLAVPLPSPPAQARRAAPILAIDDFIQNNRRRIEVLEEMVRAIYREWFVHFRYPGHDDVPIADSPLGPIPNGWRVGCVDDLVTLIKITVDPSALDPSTPAVGLEHIPRRQITLGDWGIAGDLGSRKATFAGGDVLFGKIRPYFHKVSVAPVEGVCSTDAIVLRPHPDHWGQAVLALASDEFVAHAVQTSNGTKMPRADWKVIRQFPVAVPPAGIARRFSEAAQGLLGHARSLMFQSRELASMRDALLPKLVTGQIDESRLDLGDLDGAGTA